MVAHADYDARKLDPQQRGPAAVTVAPATLLELAELGGAHSRQAWGEARALMAAGHLYAFRAGNELIALGGFVPIAGVPGAGHMVLNAAPGLSRHALGFIRCARLTIAAAPYRPILTVCVSEAGRLFAQRLGFTFQTASDFGEVWAYDAVAEQSLRRKRRAAEGAAAAGGPDSGEPADQPGADRGRAGAA